MGGGQALARYILDTPALVAGKQVVDLGSGSGLTAIAARLAGASHVLAADIDVFAVAAIQLNAAVNGVTVEATSQDLLAGSPAPCGVVLIGDLFYERQLAGRVLKYIDQVKSQGASIFIGDPQRNYFPRGRFERQADYRVPVTRELEDAEIKHSAVWRA